MPNKDEPCILCGEVEPVAGRTFNDLPLCIACMNYMKGNKSKKVTEEAK